MLCCTNIVCRFWNAHVTGICRFWNADVAYRCLLAICTNQSTLASKSAWNPSPNGFSHPASRTIQILASFLSIHTMLSNADIQQVLLPLQMSLSKFKNVNNRRVWTNDPLDNLNNNKCNLSLLFYQIARAVTGTNGSMGPDSTLSYLDPP